MEFKLKSEYDPDKQNSFEVNYYNYDAINSLEKNIDYFLNVSINITKINICAYEINNSGLYPFIKYLLYKDPIKPYEHLYFPSMPYLFNNMNSDTIIAYVNMYLINILLSETTERDYVDKIIFKGFYISNDEVYIFYDISKCKIEMSDVNRSTPMWFALIDELLNDRNVCNFNINSEVTDFFVNNIEFCFLKDRTGNNYPSPVVAYSGVHDKLLNFRFMFGVSAEDKKAILGNYFYFTDYRNAIKQGAWSKTGKPEYRHGKLITDKNSGKYIRGGIIRFALFFKSTKIIQNFDFDDIDNSNIKKEMLNDDNLDKHYEHMTLRISDHDGNWTKDYDSAFIGPVKLDDDTILKNAPLYVVKKYDQQLPLTYHYIDKSFLKDKYEEDADYLIM